MNKFTLLELAVIYSALECYQDHLNELISLPQNSHQEIKINGEILAAKELMPKIKQLYLSQGGPSDCL